MVRCFCTHRVRPKTTRSGESAKRPRRWVAAPHADGEHHGAAGYDRTVAMVRTGAFGVRGLLCYSSRDTGGRAEDGIRTRDPHLGKIVEVVHADRTSPLNWPSVCGSSTESARVQACCRAVYYERNPSSPTGIDTERPHRLRSDHHPPDGGHSSSTQCDCQRHEKSRDSGGADGREKVTQARPGT